MVGSSTRQLHEGGGALAAFGGYSKTRFGVQDICLSHPVVHFVILFYIWASLLVSQLKWDTNRGFGTT